MFKALFFMCLLATTMVNHQVDAQFGFGLGGFGLGMPFGGLGMGMPFGGLGGLGFGGLGGLGFGMPFFGKKKK